MKDRQGRLDSHSCSTTETGRRGCDRAGAGRRGGRRAAQVRRLCVARAGGEPLLPLFTKAGPVARELGAHISKTRMEESMVLKERRKAREGWRALSCTTCGVLLKYSERAVSPR